MMPLVWIRFAGFSSLVLTLAAICMGILATVSFGPFATDDDGNQAYNIIQSSIATLYFEKVSSTWRCMPYASSAADHPFPAQDFNFVLTSACILMTLRIDCVLKGNGLVYQRWEMFNIAIVFTMFLGELKAYQHTHACTNTPSAQHAFGHHPQNPC